MGKLSAIEFINVLIKEQYIRKEKVLERLESGEIEKVYQLQKEIDGLQLAIDIYNGWSNDFE